MSELNVFRYDDSGLNDAVAIVGFPTVGLVGSIIGSYIVRELKMPVLRGMYSDNMSPYSILINGDPYPPIRVHGFCRDEKEGRCNDLMVITSEIAPDARQCCILAREILDMCKEYGVKTVVCLEGIPRYSSDDVSFAAGNSPRAREMIKGFGLEPLENGMIKGLTGVMLFEGKERNIDVVTILSPAEAQLPDPRSAAEVLKKLTDVIPELKDIDLTPLVQEAEELEKRIRSQTEIGEAKPPEDDNHLYG
ncbi:MAG: proteasome assembly chaperone family protein [Candidatus Methanomethylophilaceae archaeon]|jgi:uncharacterized protein